MRRKALTLIEILVSVILIGIALAALAIVLTTGRLFIKRAKNDAAALSLALLKKEELLSHSYGDLNSGSNSGQEDSIFDWLTTVTEKSVCDAANNRCIPYKEITVRVEYPEETIKGTASSRRKRVIVKNIIPYPRVHLYEVNTGVVACTTGVSPNCAVPFNTWRLVGDGGPESLQINIASHPVDKDLLVIYNIAINVENQTGAGGDLDADDSILTKVQLDGADLIGNVETRTPILSQAVISNIIRINDVERNIPHTVDVQWFKKTEDQSGNPEDHGVISIKKANLIVIAFERP